MAQLHRHKSDNSIVRLLLKCNEFHIFTKHSRNVQNLGVFFLLFYFSLAHKYHRCALVESEAQGVVFIFIAVHFE